MADNLARKEPEEFEPGGGPGWQPEVLPGGGETTPERGDLRSVSEDGEREQLGLGSGNSAGSAGSERSMLQPDEETGKGKGRLRGALTRRRAVGGGLIGLLLGGGFGLFIFFSGPLEFIHLSQLMQQLHFSDNEDFADSQLTRFYRWMRWKDKPGNRRLSQIGIRQADKLTTRFAEAGFDLKEDVTRNPDGSYTENLTKRGYLNYLDIDVAKALAKGIDVDGLSRELGIPIENGRLVIKIDPKNPLKFYRNKKIIREARRAIRQTGLVASLQGNAISRRAGLTRHPIQALDRATREKGIDAMRRAWQRVRGQTLSGSATPVHISSTDDDQDPETPSDSQAAADELQSDIDSAEVDEFGQKSGALRKKIGFSAAALALAYCTARELASGADEQDWQQLGIGSMRLASYYVGLGAQVQASQDIDLEQLGFEKELLYDRSDDGDDATKPSSWASAESIQKIQGKPGGIALSAAYRVDSGQNILSQLLAKIPRAAAAALNAACSAAGSWLGQAIQIGVDFALGPVSATLGTAGGALFGNDVTNFLTRQLTREGIPLNLAGGALGGVVDQGGFFLSNQEFLSTAATALTPAKGAEVRRYLAEAERREFQARPLGERLFAVKDRRSLAGQVFDNAPREVGTAVAGLLELPQRSLGQLAGIFDRPAYAGEADYDYGVPVFGFSLDEYQSLDDSHDNPYDNAEIVRRQKCEGKSCFTYFNEQDFDKDCFGLEVAADDIIRVVDLPRQDRYPGKCKRSDDAFLRYRLHIANVMTAESLACYEGEEDACTRLGY
jgi:hypothetical protein